MCVLCKSVCTYIYDVCTGYPIVATTYLHTTQYIYICVCVCVLNLVLAVGMQHSK